MSVLTLTALSGVGRADDELVKKRIERVQNGGSKKRMSPGERFVEKFGAWTNILPHLADRAQLPDEEDRCNLYLADTSIPGAGFGLFAGKSIGEGSTVVDAGMILPIGSSTMAQHQLIIKPHSTASNVVLTKKPDGHAYFVAKRNIEPGEEIFVDEPTTGDDSASYYSLFTNVPTPASYALADDILANEFKDLTRKKTTFGDRKSKISHPGRKNKEAQTTGAIDQVDVQSLIVIRNIVKRFDPLAASLLPVTSSRLGLSMVLGAGVAALNNRTIHSIHQKGQCFDGITTTIAEGEMEDTLASKGPVLTRNVAEGDVIMSLPLYIVTPETSNIPEDFASICLKIGNESLLFCPLSHAHASIKHASSNNKPAVSEEDECTNCPNARYTWSSWNPSKDIVSGMGIERASKEYPVGLSLDIIATRDINRGEEILLDSASLEQASAVVEENTASTNTMKTEL